MELPEVMGLPPSTYVSDNLINNSMPVAEFTPSKTNYQSGLTLFTLKDATDKYKEIVENHGYTPSLPLKLAFIADNFPSDSFQNEYGANFLENIADVVSEGAHTISQTFGGKSATEVVGNIGKELKGAGGLPGMAGKGLMSGVKQAQQFIGEHGGAGHPAGGGNRGAVSKMAGLMDKMLAGARVDFPQIWKNSSFTPSYTMTIRLYNPNPGSQEQTDKYIIGPLAAILSLGLPMSEGTNTYHWPFFHKIRCKGLFVLDPAIITNITVIKGGDQQQIGHTHRLGIVDVRIDISGLFQSMLLETKSPSKNPDRPTLAQYLNNLKEQKNVEDIYESPENVEEGEMKNAPKGAEDKQKEQQTTEVASSGGGETSPTSAGTRVSSNKRDVASNLSSSP